MAVFELAVRNARAFLDILCLFGKIKRTGAAVDIKALYLAVAEHLHYFAVIDLLLARIAGHNRIRDHYYQDKKQNVGKYYKLTAASFFHRQRPTFRVLYYSILL